MFSISRVQAAAVITIVTAIIVTADAVTTVTASPPTLSTSGHMMTIHSNKTNATGTTHISTKPTTAKTTGTTMPSPTTAMPTIFCPVKCNCTDKKVDCSNQSLTEVPRGIPTDTTILILSNNSISSLNRTNSPFENLTALELLDISNNKLKVVEAGAFKTCSSLNEIHFTNNSLGNSGIEPGVFNDTKPAMYYIYLEMNGMDENITAEMFMGMTSITGLRFANNNFTTIKKGMFQYTKGLSDVRFEYNRLKTIEMGVWVGVPLTIIDLRYNNFTRLTYSMFSGMTEMFQFYLLGNPLTGGIEDGTFKDMSKLTFITLEGNMLTSLSPYTFQGLSMMKTCRLYANLFETIDATVFSKNSPDLETLLLWDNKIWKLTGSLKTLTKLKLVELNINNIKNVDGSFFPNTSETQLSIDLSRNPLHCNCLLNWTGSPVGLLNSTVAGTCNTPNVLHSRKVPSIPREQFKCIIPRITSITDNITVARGDNVTLYCAAAGDPLPTITWSSGRAGVSKVIDPPSDSSLQSNDGTLTLTNFSDTYQGNYTCAVTSPLHEPYSMARTLSVKLGPRTSIPPVYSYSQYSGAIAGSIIGTFILTLLLAGSVGFCLKKRTAKTGYSTM